MTQHMRLNVRTATRDHIHQCAEALAQGDCVTLPDVSGEWTVRTQSGDRSQTEPASDSPVPSIPLLLLHSRAAFGDFVPNPTTIQQRFVRKGWPGKAILEVHNPLQALLERRGLTGNRLKLFVLSHWFSQSVLELIPEPPEVVNWICDGKQQQFSSSLVPRIHVSDDELSEAQPAQICFQPNNWTIVEMGSQSPMALQEMAGRLFLFVCTGNTCRSPMAERLFQSVLAERLGCPAEELGKHGFYAASAGLAAPPAYPASAESVSALQRRGIDLSDHLSQQLTEELLDQADSVFTMTQSHQQTILRARPDTAERVHTLSSENVVDPIGGTADEYEACCRQIEARVRQIVAEISIDD